MVAVDRNRSDEQTSWHRVDTLVAAGLGLVLSVLFLLTATTGPAQVNDTRAASIGAWTLGTQGTVALPEDWPASRNYWGVVGRDGRVLVNRFPGVAYWATPAYLVADVTGSIGRPQHPLLVPAGPAAAASALTAAAFAVALYRLLREVAGRRAALGGVVVVATGTSVWSVAADAMWPHGPAMLLLTGMLLAWRRCHPAVAAACASGAVLVRPHLIVVVVVLAVFAWRRERPRDGAALAGGGLLGLVALSAYTAWAFGTLLPIAGYDAAAHLGGLLRHDAGRTVRDLALAFVSRTRGLLVFSPALVPAVVALARGWRRLPPWTLASAVAGLLYLLVQVRALGYRGGEDFFAYRISLEPLVLATPALVLACAESVRRSRRWAAAFGLLVLASIGLHGYGAVAGGVTDDTVRAWERIQDRLGSGGSDVQGAGAAAVVAAVEGDPLAGVE